MNRFVSVLIAGSVALGRIIHVPAEYPTLQQGIDAAQAYDVVMVAPGRYVEEIQLKDRVTVQGAGPGSSIIDGGGDAGDVVRAIGNAITAETKLRGFTITGAANGGGMPGGAGVFCNSGARPDIGDCLITGNDAGVALWNGSPARVHNCVIVHNTYDAVSTGCYATVVNNTIHGNRIGFYDYSGYGPVFMNNIVTGQSLFGVYGPSGGSPPALTYNDVWGNATNYQQAVPGTGSISRDPMYVDTAAGDFHLQPGSPCIDSGNPDPQYNDPDGTRNDMGAYGGPGAGSNRPAVVSLDPAQNALNVAPDATVAAGFNRDMSRGTLNQQTVRLNGAWSGWHWGTVEYDSLGRVVTLDPEGSFFPGEPATAVLAKAITTQGGESLPGFAWDFTVAAGGGSGRFSETLQVTSGHRANSVLPCDFDRDGNVDLALAHLGSDYVTVRLGRGDGTFGDPRWSVVDSSPARLCAGDFNSDSIPDLAATAWEGAKVAVLLGRGDGSFAPAAYYEAVPVAGGFVCGDFDLDGDLDLAACGPMFPSLAVLMGNGDGTFGPARYDTVYEGIQTLATGDLNRDGYPDLVAAMATSTQMMSFLGRGDGTFDTLPRIELNDDGRAIQLGDFNEDGLLDAAVACPNASRVLVMAGTGTGAFGTPANYPITGTPIRVRAADLNADGHLDIATANNLSDNAAVLLGPGDGTFGTPNYWSTANDPCDLAAADFTSDGDIDLVVLSYTPVMLTLLLNDDALNVTRPWPVQHAVGAAETTNVAAGFSQALRATSLDSISFSAWGAQTGLHLGTISYDSATATATLDPAANFACGEKVTAMLTKNVEARTGVRLRGYGWTFTTRVFGRSSGTFADAVGYPTGVEPRGEWAADFDGDGDIDLVTTGNSPAAMALLRNNGDGTFATPSYTSVNSDPIDVHGADFDRDGDIDVAVFHNQPGTSHLEILRNDGAGNFALVHDYAPAILGQHLAGGDIDADGDIDLVLTDGWGSQNNVRVMTNVGNCVFSGPTSYSAGAWARGVQVTDVDNDGDMDLCVTSEGDDNMTVLYNDGNGNFMRLATFATGNAPEGLYAGDFDGDGWVDLAVAQAGETNVSVLLNDGRGGFVPPAAYSTNVAQMTVEGGDIDGDGDIDLCCEAHGTDSVIALKNNGDGTFGVPARYRVAGAPWTVRLADYNRDGALDIAVTSHSTARVEVLLGVGLGVAGWPPANQRMSLTVRPSVFRDRLHLAIRGAPAGAVVSIHDASGRLVRVLTSGGEPSAARSLHWDARDGLGRKCATGVYLVRLAAGQEAITSKVVLGR